MDSPRLRVYERPGLCLPRVERGPHRGPLLRRLPAYGQDDVVGIELSSGSGDAYALHFGSAPIPKDRDATMILYVDAAERLEEALASMEKLPRAVIVSPRTDPFPPHAEFQAETARVVGALARRGVDAWLTTRGFIRPSAERVLAAHRDRVRLTIGLTTLDRTIQRVLEPLAASPRMRLRQVARLEALGIKTQVALEPLVPGLTDTRAGLMPLLEALAAIGVRQVSASYLFVKPGIRERLTRVLEPHGWHDVVLDAYADGCALRIGEGAPAWCLSKSRRQRGYATLMALAAGLGMTVRVNASSNPDFRVPSGEPVLSPRQRLLPCV